MAVKTFKPKNVYPCEQNELYAVCVLGYNSFNDYVTQFAAYKPSYTLPYSAAKVSEVLLAAAIPGYQARTSLAEQLRIQLIEKSEECVNKWQDLKGYIIGAFPKNLQKPNFEEAGIEFYKQALNHNWEKLSSLMSYGYQYITNHSTELMANNNMPATFPPQIDQLKIDTTLLYIQFQHAMDGAENITVDKINANNKIYQDLILMFEDGQRVFRHDPAIREQFTFSKVLERVRGASTAFHEFDVPVNDSIKIKKIVEHSPFVNIGDTELIVFNGEGVCIPSTGTTVLPGATIIIQEDIKTITVLNTDTALKGKCKIRVIKK